MGRSQAQHHGQLNFQAAALVFSTRVTNWAGRCVAAISAAPSGGGSAATTGGSYPINVPLHTERAGRAWTGSQN